MKYLLPLFFLTPVAYADSDIYLSLGKGLRHGAYNVAAGWEPITLGHAKLGAELEFIDCGEQPDPYQNINRMLNINAVAHVKFNDYVTGFGKYGVSSTRYSHNGTNSYEADDGFVGTTASVGLETPLNKNLMVGFQASVFEYQQSNNPNMGGYSNAVIHVRWKL
jgi:hypothetical protein